jgi:hypothetical protein
MDSGEKDFIAHHDRSTRRALRRSPDIDEMPSMTSRPIGASMR